MSDGRKEYVVTLKNAEDLDKFYDDMESPGGDLYIPARRVEVANLRPLSLNTNYYLSDSEADTLRKDPRVAAVEIPISQNPMVQVTPLFEQTSSFWNKSNILNANHKNWGLLRCVNGHVPGWGSDGTQTVSGTINVKAEGNGVDVVIVDGIIPPSHPEFAVNSDGTGGSRVVQYNWFALNPQVTGGSAGTYTYSGGAINDNNHGTHVAGTVCGNTQGWARKATIYNISPYGLNGVLSEQVFDYIRAFHAAKPVKRPTIVNCSYGLGFSIDFPLVDIVSVVRRGVTYNRGAGWNESTLKSYGVPTITTLSTGQRGIYRFGTRSAAVDADVASAIQDGIIVVGAAGNDDATMVASTNQDFNNYFVCTVNGESIPFYYQQGSSPTAASTCICVGAVDSTSSERKASYSNTGGRVDIFSPGTFVMSPGLFGTTQSNGSLYPMVSDARASGFYLTKLSGTSMASPQVTGVLACLLEIYPRMNQAMAIDYLKAFSQAGALSDSGLLTDYSNANGLRGGNNRYLKHKNERPDTGIISPRRSYWLRKSSGFVYPRTANSALGRV